MISFDDAVALAATAGERLGVERVPLGQAHRRVLAEAVLAQVRSPPADVSSMDGYAVRESDLANLPVALPVAGESFAGAPFAGALPAASCIRIFTGAAVPAGADRVIIQEVVEREDDRARFVMPLSPARHIRRAGSDFERGQELIAEGIPLAARALVAAAGADLSDVHVARQPRLRLLSTGDELVEPGLARSTPDSIPESVSFGVAAMAEDWGGRVEGVLRLPDDLQAMQRAVSEALRAADLVVVTGGASVGQKDFAKTMFEPAGLQLLFSKVSMKPGKPAWFGRAGGRLVLGLPGNPTSALVTARLFLAPLLCCLTGRDSADALAWRGMSLAHELEPTGERETFSRGYADGDAVRLFDHQDSSAQQVLAKATLLVRRPSGDQPIAEGSRVDVLDF